MTIMASGIMLSIIILDVECPSQAKVNVRGREVIWQTLKGVIDEVALTI